MNAQTGIRALAAAFIALTVVFCASLHRGVEVWWNLPIRVAFMVISSLPALMVFLKDSVARSPRLAITSAAVLAGYSFFYAVLFLGIGFSPGRSGVPIMGLLLLVLLLAAVLIVHWFVVWIRTSRDKAAGMLGSLLLALLLFFATLKFLEVMINVHPP